MKKNMDHLTNGTRAINYLCGKNKIVLLPLTTHKNKLYTDQRFKYENTVKLLEEIIGDIHIKKEKFFLLPRKRMIHLNT